MDLQLNLSKLQRGGLDLPKYALHQLFDHQISAPPVWNALTPH
jgi:hypothetical protein